MTQNLGTVTDPAKVIDDLLASATDAQVSFNFSFLLITTRPHNPCNCFAIANGKVVACLAASPPTRHKCPPTAST